MADSDQQKVIYIRVDASAAIDGSNKATQALAKMEAGIGSMSSTLDKMEAALNRVGSYLKAELILQITQLVGKLAEMAKSAFDAAANLGNIAEQAGVTAQYLQSVQFAAVQVGVSSDQATESISKFNQRMGEAAAGNKGVIDGLNSLGVKILDVNGNLKPTATNLTNVAAGILAINDPAKQAAASVEFFGKSGAKMQTVLQDLAKGSDALAASLAGSGALISDKAIKTLDDFSAAVDRNKLKNRAAFAELLADTLDFLERTRQALQVGTDEQLKQQAQSEAQNVKKAFEDASDSIHDAENELVAGAARFAAEFIESLKTLPGAIANLFAQGMDLALEKVEGGLNKMKAGFANSWLGQQLGVDGTPLDLGRVGSVSNSDYLAGRNGQIAAAGQAAYDATLAGLPGTQGYAATRAQQRYLQSQADIQTRGSNRRMAFAPPDAGGGSNPPPTASGESPEDKYKKLEQQLTNTAAAQDAMTKAAQAGDQEFDQAKAKVDAQNKLLEIFKTQLSDTDPRLTKIRDLLLDISKGQAAQAFAQATTELQKQNVLLDTQIKFFDAAPAVQAHEIALIKTKNELAKTGEDIDSAAGQARLAAIEQNERLTQQQDQLKKAQELWTEPLKQALRDIQTAASDAFEQILTSGNFSFQSLAATFKTIITKMAAEFLALATVRPIMSVLVNAVSSTGLISANTVNQLGFGSTGAGGSGSLGLSGGGIGGSAFGGLGGGIGDFLNTPFTGPYAGLSPSSMAGVPTLSGAAGAGLTPLGAAGAGLGIGAGIYGLATAKTPSGMIGSGLGILGGGLGLASMLGAGAALGPIGIGVGLLGGLLSSTGLLDGLFGSKQPINSYGTGGLNYGSGGFTTNGSTYGANAASMGTTGALGAAGQSIQSVFNLLGGVQDPSKVYGLQLGSFNQQYADGSSFSNKTSYIVGPDGSRRQWGQGSTDQDVGLDTASAEAALESILNGAVGKVTDTMRKALTDLDNAGGPATLDQIQATVTEVKGFDDAMASLGKTVDPMTTALQQVDAQFQSLYDTASKYGFDTSAIDTAKSAAELKVGTDFAKTITDQLLDPETKALNDIGDQRTANLKSNSALMGVQGYVDQAQNIELLYLKQRNAILDQYNQAALQAQQAATAQAMQSIQNLQDLIARLTPGGDLANIDPSGQLAGLSATYSAARAQAFANPNDQTALSSYVTAGGNYAQFAEGYYGGSTDYNPIRDQIVADAQTIQQTLGGGTAGAAPAAQAASDAQFQQLLDVLAQTLQDNAQLKSQMSRILARGS